MNISYNLNINFTLFFLIFSFILSCIILGLSYFLTKQKLDFEKISSYECGFDPFNDTRDPFQIKFYLTAILFIIFDLEILYFFPWILSLKEISLTGYYTMYLFLFILTIGYIYEWKKKSIDWE